MLARSGKIDEVIKKKKKEVENHYSDISGPSITSGRMYRQADIQQMALSILEKS